MPPKKHNSSKSVRMCRSFDLQTRCCPSFCKMEASIMCVGSRKCGYWYCDSCYNNTIHLNGECFISGVATNDGDYQNNSAMNVEVSVMPAQISIIDKNKSNKTIKTKRNQTINTDELGGNSSCSSSNLAVTRQSSHIDSDDDFVFKERTDMGDSNSSGDTYENSDNDDDDDSEIGELEGIESRDALTGEGAVDVIPESHELSRKREGRQNNRGTGKKKKSLQNKTDPGVPVSVRISEFPLQPFEERNKSLWCASCSSTVSVKKSSIKTHIRSKTHRESLSNLGVKEDNLLQGAKEDNGMQVAKEDNLIQVAKEGNSTKVAKKDNSIRRYAVKRDTQSVAESEHSTYKKSNAAKRKQLCYAFLFDGIPLEVLNDPMPTNGIRKMLQENCGTLSYREIKDVVPAILDMLKEELIKELKVANDCSIIFDGSVNEAEVFIVVFRFWKNHKIAHRLGALKIINKEFDRDQLGPIIINILALFGVKSVNIRAAICDGSPVNHAALIVLKNEFNEISDPICISHSSGVVGNYILECLPLAKRFEEKWSIMNECSLRSRQVFREHSGIDCLRQSEVKWYRRFENLVQIYDNSATVNHVLVHPDEFSDSLRVDLKDMIQPEVAGELRMELALAKDTSDSLVTFCHSQEDDAPFVSVTTYDQWMEVMQILHDITNHRVNITRKREILPSVTEIALTFSDDVAIQNKLIVTAGIRVLPVYENMRQDSDGKLSRTLNIFRACRMFGYKFIAENAIETLQAEVVQLVHINRCFQMSEQVFLDELSNYKRVAELEMRKEEVHRPDNHTFWLRYALTLINWFRASRDVGLITPSSAASIQRVFSLLNQFCSSSQQQSSILEDEQCASCMIRFNDNWKPKVL